MTDPRRDTCTCGLKEDGKDEEEDEEERAEAAAATVAEREDALAGGLILIFGDALAGALILVFGLDVARAALRRAVTPTVATMP